MISEITPYLFTYQNFIIFFFTGYPPAGFFHLHPKLDSRPAGYPLPLVGPMIFIIT
jgi:hypothetical protein